MGLEKPNSGLDPGETFFPNSVSDLGSAETFQISRNVGLVIDENVCLLDSQPWIAVTRLEGRELETKKTKKTLVLQNFFFFTAF